MLFNIPILIPQLTLFLFFPHFIFEAPFFSEPWVLWNRSFRECCLLFIQKSLCLVRGKFHSTLLKSWVDFNFSSFCNWVFFLEFSSSSWLLSNQPISEKVKVFGFCKWVLFLEVCLSSGLLINQPNFEKVKRFGIWVWFVLDPSLTHPLLPLR